jgi:hypothetical protein
MSGSSSDDQTWLGHFTILLGNWILRQFSPPRPELAAQLSRANNANPDVLEQLKEDNKANPALVEQLRKMAKENTGMTNVTEETVKMPVKMPEVIIAFHSVFEDRCRSYGLAFVVVVLLVSGSDYFLQGSLPNQFLGLTIEVLGAAVLGRGLLKSVYGITGEILRFNIAEVLASDMVDRMFGLFLLGTGVLTQYLALLGLAVPYSLIS